MECNPCGEVAGRELGHRLAVSGGAAVALARATLDYTSKFRMFTLNIGRRLELFKQPLSPGKGHKAPYWQRGDRVVLSDALTLTDTVRVPARQ